MNTSSPPATPPWEDTELTSSPSKHSSLSTINEADAPAYAPEIRFGSKTLGMERPKDNFCKNCGSVCLNCRELQAEIEALKEELKIHKEAIDRVIMIVGPDMMEYSSAQSLLDLSQLSCQSSSTAGDE